MTLFEKIVQLQIPHSNHCSDLYIPVTQQTTELLKEYKTWADTFTNQVEGGQWYAVAFAYDPYWVARGVYCAEMWQLPQNSQHKEKQMDKTVAQVAAKYDQELAECRDLIQTMLGNENGRELLSSVQNVITAMQEREGKEIEAVTTQTVGIFAQLGYIAAMHSLGECFSQPKDSDE